MARHRRHRGNLGTQVSLIESSKQFDAFKWRLKRVEFIGQWAAAPNETEISHGRASWQSHLWSPLDVSNTSHLRDLAASAARIFGWNKSDKPGVQLNQQFCISQEQLDQIRAFWEQAEAQESPSDTPGCP